MFLICSSGFVEESAEIVTNLHQLRKFDAPAAYTASRGREPA